MQITHTLCRLKKGGWVQSREKKIAVKPTWQNWEAAAAWLLGMKFEQSSRKKRRRRLATLWLSAHGTWVGVLDGSEANEDWKKLWSTRPMDKWAPHPPTHTLIFCSCKPSSSSRLIYVSHESRALHCPSMVRRHSAPHSSNTQGRGPNGRSWNRRCVCHLKFHFSHTYGCDLCVWTWAEARAFNLSLFPVV